MGLSLFATLLLLGSWVVLTAFLGGDRLARRGEVPRPPAPRRILTALALLGLAGVVGIVTVVREPPGRVYPAYAALALLLAGAGTALATFRRTPAAEGEGTARPGMTKRAWAALALLSSAEVVALLNDRLVDAVEQVQVQSGAVSQALGAPALFFLVLGTGAAGWIFLGGGQAAPSSTGPGLRWFVPRP
jgi:hypothetical protein